MTKLTNTLGTNSVEVKDTQEAKNLQTMLGKYGINVKVEETTENQTKALT